MLNSHPKWMSRGRFSFRMSIEHWELNIDQILPSPRPRRRDMRTNEPHCEMVVDWIPRNYLQLRSALGTGDRSDQRHGEGSNGRRLTGCKSHCDTNRHRCCAEHPCESDRMLCTA